MTYQDTSRDAFEGSARGLNERKVLVLVRCSPDGMTCDEFMNRTGMQHQSASPAFTALTRRGLLMRTDKRRATRSGQKAAVYVAVDPGTLFSSPTRPKADVYRDVVRAALNGRATGDWAEFDSALSQLPNSELKRIKP
jgi:hypothetical protein